MLFQKVAHQKLKALLKRVRIIEERS